MGHVTAADAVAARPALQCGRAAAGVTLPDLRPPVMGRSGAPVRLLRGQGLRNSSPVVVSAFTQESGSDIDEEAIMRMAESLPPEDRGKALKLWEENKKMRNKLAILESVTELPVDQRFRALDLLKENRTLRSTTGSLLQTWDSLKDTVAALSFTMESEAHMAAAQAAEADAEIQSNEEETEEEYPEFDPMWTFWEAGLSSPGTVELITADGALQLALMKAEAMAEAEVDDILNRYWQVELAPQDSPNAPVSEAEEPVLPVANLMDDSAAVGSLAEAAEAGAAPSTIEAASEAGEGTVEEAVEETLVPEPELVVATQEVEQEEVAEDEEEERAAAEAAEALQEAPEMDEEEMDVAEPELVVTAQKVEQEEAVAQEEEERAAAEVAEALQEALEMDEEVMDVAEPELVVTAQEVEQEEEEEADLLAALKHTAQKTVNRNNAGVVAAAAGLGAGMLAVAAGMETAAAMEIMATTALVASAGSLLGSDSASKDLQKKGARAPALFAIATTLNAADNLTKTIDRALESEKSKTIAKVAENAAKMMAFGGGKNEKADDSDSTADKAPPEQAFSVQRKLAFGQSVVMVGTCPELGGWDGSFGRWDASKALPMQWQEGDNWVAAAQLPPGTVEFSFGVASKDGSISWEGQTKRQLEVPSDASSLFVQYSWEDAENKLVLTDQEAQTSVSAVRKAMIASAETDESEAESEAAPEAKPKAETEAQVGAEGEAEAKLETETEAQVTDSYVEGLVSQQADELVIQPASNAAATQFEDTQAFALFLDAMAADHEEQVPYLDTSMDDGQGEGGSTPPAVVAFGVHKKLPFGQRLKVVGSCPSLGNWDISRAPKMTWTEDHLWVTEVPLPVGTHDFKFAVISSDSNATLYWETQGGNRTVTVPEGTARLMTKGSFGSVKDMEIFIDSDAHPQTSPALK